MDKIINFNPEGMKGLHFYIEGLNFPIAIGTYSDWEIDSFYDDETDTEINIDSIDIIDKCGEEKQVSPAPKRMEFYF